MLAAGKILACSMTLGIGGSGGVFAPSLFIGVTSGMAFGEIADHVFGPGAGQPALYAVVAMGAVFTSAARAPLTSLASVVELTGDFTLTLPVMLAVAIASTVSRMLSYGTIYTTKLLRRGIDVHRAAPWRAFGDLKVSEAMQKLGTPLPCQTGTPAGRRQRPDLASLPGPVTHQGDPQVLFSNESVAQALRQLEVYGNDGLPVLSPDGLQVQGWVTNASVLRSIAHRIDASGQQGPQTQPAAEWACAGPEVGPPRAAHPAARLPGPRSHHPRRLPRRRAAARDGYLAARMDPGLRTAPPAAGNARPRPGPQPRRPHQPARAQPAGHGHRRTRPRGRGPARPGGPGTVPSCWLAGGTSQVACP